MKKSRTRTASVAAAVALGLALGGCSSAEEGSGAGEPASLTFWGWSPGYADAVQAFNKAHPGIEVTYQEVQPGAKGGYQKMLNAVQAGNAPCLAQVGYETLPSFAAQGALEDVSQHAKGDEKDFQQAAWRSVSLGDAVYGAPVDTGPMALFYNRKVYDSLGLKPPATWDEYKAQAKRIHASDPDRYISSPYLSYDYAGLSWQAGAGWFGVDGDAWRVGLASEADQKVADYWQGLVDEGLISGAPMYDQAWYAGLGSGNIATVVGAVWQAGVIKGGVKDGAGDWAVAPMPQWRAGDKPVGNAGGSATAVLKGCESTEAAWTFAHWLSTDRAAYGDLVTKASLYPAAPALLDLPQLKAADPYFGGQKIYDVFAAAAPEVNPDWTWGPVMTKTTADLDDGLGKAWAGKGTFKDALRSAQDKTVAELRNQGMKVAE
ncbi:multiple sugar transport system substrate-binding protein [Streptomyces sp. V4I23]|uniref:ABC transporter substrate-binding protein n=1 Tax=Streptomyces sp. V4I23 TaxID=3042282 RepID=UPI00278507A4|nr:sugar ABC transporter substrate-binding protein [Streptomyces sp. V4I23]MDQ1006642.1 multiple sugar transport system substrate-binding protein [Streptomyces sp. V4I23]